MDCNLNCPLRLYSKLKYKGIGNTTSNRMIIIPYIDSYCRTNLTKNQIYKKLNEIYNKHFKRDLIDDFYITSLLKCKSNKNVDYNSVVNICSRYYLNREIFTYNPSVILLIGNATNYVINKSTNVAIHRIYNIYGRRYLSINNPKIEEYIENMNFEASVLKVFNYMIFNV